MSSLYTHDIPICDSADDNLGIAADAQALADLIVSVDTPFTLSIQGEWGSGKTSLMRLVAEKLAAEPDIQEIDLDSWEYFVSGDSEQGTQRIIASLVQSIMQKCGLQDKLKDKISHNLRDFLAKGAGVMASLQGGDGENVTASLASSANTAEQLRQAVADLVKRGGGKTFVFFVDDLDRLEPKVAVDILEILKNVFFIEHCVFVIAIDFNVVARGLAQKYGAGALGDEHIYRDYFDKLFQFSYIVPVQVERSKQMLTRGLADIGYLDKADPTLLERLCDAVAGIVGSNPRKLKRFLTSLRFCVLQDHYNHDFLAQGSEEQKLVNALVIALKVVCPDFVLQLCRFPEFWHPTQLVLDALAQTPEKKSAALDLRRNWAELYRQALSHSPFKGQVDQIMQALMEINQGLENDRNILFSQVLGLSGFVNTNYGNNVGMKAQDYAENVQTTVAYGRVLLDKYELPEKGRILHLTPADGQLTLELLRRYPKIQVTAVSAEVNLLQAFQKALDEAPDIDDKRVKLEQLRIDQLAYDQKFDAVFSTTGAHWAGQVFYMKAYAALKAGGKLLVEQSSKGTYQAMRQVLAQVMEEFGFDLASKPEPFYLYDEAGLKQVLADCGFKGTSLKVQIEQDDTIAPELLYQDYAMTNAQSYLELFGVAIDKPLRAQIEERFLELCQQLHPQTIAYPAYVYAEK
ncbi:MAG: AAA family ATPase [Coriobacteriales bacterium]|jgi:hypothetical protein|nr:AAA family ATPase [Coriobacteriales bacterium]